MQSQNEKLQVTASSIASGSGVFIGAVLFGICGAMRKCLENISDYCDLLGDEVEDNPSAMAYIEGQQDNLRKVQAMLKAPGMFMQDSGSNERLHLIKIIEGVLSRYQMSLPVERHLSSEIDDTLFVRCNPFQIQQLLFEMLNEFHLNDEASHWELKCSRMRFSSNELGALQIENDGGSGEFAVVRLNRIGEDLPLTGQYMPVEACLALWPNLSQERLYQYVEWLGLVLLNGGRLLLRSEENEKGAALLFPIAAEWRDGNSEGGNPDSVMHYSWSSGEPQKTILLVDDEDMIWDVITEMLQELGYNVVLAGNGREAVEIYQANTGKIDLVILDMLMPDMGGKEAFYILRKIDPNAKVLISSGYVSENEIQDVMDDGASGFLRKPYRMADLARKIKTILSE